MKANADSFIHRIQRSGVSLTTEEKDVGGDVQASDKIFGRDTYCAKASASTQANGTKTEPKPQEKQPLRDTPTSRWFPSPKVDPSRPHIASTDANGPFYERFGSNKSALGISNYFYCPEGFPGPVKPMTEFLDDPSIDIEYKEEMKKKYWFLR